jgi:hypothetical protein
VIKANAKHRNRFLEQANEFAMQEKQLRNWGLHKIVPIFRLQAWARLSRSALLEEITRGIIEMIETRQQKMVVYSRLFEETSNRRDKYSLEGVTEFCLDPEILMFSDMTLITLSSRLLRMDYVCSSNIRNFKQLEPELLIDDDSHRTSALMSIFARYKKLPSPLDLSNIETDLSWADFCEWYAHRQQIVSQLEDEFAAIIEDQRQQIGRLFARWVQSLLLSIPSPSVTSHSHSRNAGNTRAVSAVETVYDVSHLGGIVSLPSAVLAPQQHSDNTSTNISKQGGSYSQNNLEAATAGGSMTIAPLPVEVDRPVFSPAKETMSTAAITHHGWDDGNSAAGFTAGPSPFFLSSPISPMGPGNASNDMEGKEGAMGSNRSMLSRESSVVLSHAASASSKGAQSTVLAGGSSSAVTAGSSGGGTAGAADASQRSIAAGNPVLY